MDAKKYEAVTWMQKKYEAVTWMQKNQGDEAQRQTNFNPTTVPHC